MIFKEVYRKLDLLVKKNTELLELSFKNIDIWPIVKIVILKSSVSQWRDEEIQGKYNYRNKIKKVMNLPRLWLKEKYVEIIDYKPIPKSVDKIFLSPSNCKRAIINSKYYDVFCDGIINNLDSDSCFIAETSRQGELKYPRYTSSIFIQSKLDLYLVYYNLTKKHITKEELGQLRILADKIKRYSEESNLNFETKSFTNFILQVIIKKIFFRNFLLKYRPEQLYIISFYGSTGFAATLASKELGIKCFDIQHGVQGKYHYAYSSYFIDRKRKYNSLPDKFLVWTERDDSNIRNSLNNSPYHTSEIIGNIFINNYIKKKNFKEAVNDSMIQEQLLKIKNENSIGLISLQPETKINQIQEIISYCDINNHGKVFWLLRFHHDMNDSVRKKYFSAFEKFTNVDFEISNNSSLLQILSVIDFHITDHSSVIIEANYFGVPSIAIGNIALEYYFDYYDCKSIFWSDDKSEISKIINSITTK